MKKINWSAFWFLFFAVGLSSFAVMMMLKLTGDIQCSWWWVFAPAIVIVAFPFLVLLIALVVTVLNERGIEEDDGE